MDIKLIRSIPIRHIASMARSGETMILRQLSAHSNAVITHNLHQTDSECERRLLKFLMGWKKTSINQYNRNVRHLSLKPSSVIIIKQGTWTHQAPFKGFILARNPVCIFASLSAYDGIEKSYENRDSWKPCQDKLVSWLYGIDPTLIPGFADYDPITQFSIFYNKRMSQLIRTGLPIVYYENIVREPENELKKICNLLDLRFEEKILLAHNEFPAGQVGHGKNVLSKKINANSIYKYQSVLTRYAFEKVRELTKTVADEYKYITEWNDVQIDKK